MGAQTFNCIKSETEKYNYAKSIFKQVDFPWHVFPDEISESLQQLARSSSTSANPLPGHAFCILASAIGRKFNVCAKSSWTEPLIFWNADIRNSGEGKTPAMNSMASVIKNKQADCGEAHTYMCTDTTIEGLSSALKDHPTGGILIIMSELSKLLNSHGQYGGGTDREAYLDLHGGNTIVSLRAKKKISINSPRIQICGGIQPEIFKRQFTSKNGLYLHDGTINRFLLNYEKPQVMPIVTEDWEVHNKNAWKQTIENAFEWANTNETISARLSSVSMRTFLAWTNSMKDISPNLPQKLKGFMPKTYSYALKFAGILHLFEAFNNGEDPSDVIDVQKMNDAIDVAQFYLSRTIAALLLIDGPEEESAETRQRMADVAESLLELIPDVDNGRLAIGLIAEIYNKLSFEERNITAKWMGSFLRSIGLNVSQTLHNANGHKRVHCLAFDKKTQEFITKNCLTRNFRNEETPTDSSPQQNCPCHQEITKKRHHKIKNQHILRNIESNVANSYCKNNQKLSRFQNNECKSEPKRNDDRKKMDKPRCKTPRPKTRQKCTKTEEIRHCGAKIKDRTNEINNDALNPLLNGINIREADKSLVFGIIDKHSDTTH